MLREKIFFILRSIFTNKKILLLIAFFVIALAINALADPTIQPLDDGDTYPPGDPVPPYPFPT